jgi:hypothetical protein
MDETIETFKNNISLQLENVQLIHCPFCDFCYLRDKTLNKIKEIRCPNVNCNVMFCISCRKKAHFPAPCFGKRGSKYSEAQINLRNFVEQKMTEALIRFCGKCGKPVIKTSGCNHMSCVCGNQFCYSCGGNFSTPGKYTHPNCRIFVVFLFFLICFNFICVKNDVEEDNYKLQKAKNHAIMEWKINNPLYNNINYEEEITATKDLTIGIFFFLIHLFIIFFT